MNNLKEVSRSLRIDILKMISKSGASHIGSSYSCVDLLTFLYFKYLNISPDLINSPGRDYFILSKGHAAAALYATLAKKGFFPSENLDQYCCDEAKLSGHSTHTNTKGVEVSTGSLGHGLPISMGIAYSLKQQGLNNKVVTILSDGECQEGSNWEAFLLAPNLKLDNLIVIIDNNLIQGYGNTCDINSISNISNTLKTLGWNVQDIGGHDFNQMDDSFNNRTNNQPLLINAKTIKGKGVDFMENSIDWHYKCPSGELFDNALNQLEK